MRSRWPILMLLCVLASLLVPGIASANTAAGAETRVWAFDFTEQVHVGGSAALTLDLHRGCAPTYDQLASDSLLAAKKTVGRWMSPAEKAKMQQTGKVQEGGGGQTRVADPANPNAYKNPPKGDGYVEFDVPADRVLPHSKGTGRIAGPNSPDARVSGRNPADFEMPDATNIREP